MSASSYEMILKVILDILAVNDGFRSEIFATKEQCENDLASHSRIVCCPDHLWKFRRIRPRIVDQGGLSRQELLGIQTHSVESPHGSTRAASKP